ncbi:phospholipid scramblase 1-like isoform X2 [Paramacrobiotus metropolitanus]|nr:phospholipid scramblase 1-like isoform X2 [Paramacrobiotus metropolitanus]
MPSMPMGMSMSMQPLVIWAPMPTPIPGVPPGLEMLHGKEFVKVEQQHEWLEVFTGFEEANRYILKDEKGAYMYFAAENSHFCARWFLGTLRPFEMGIYDNIQRHVINIIRPYKCDSCCCFCCLQTMEIQAPPGTPIGFVEQDCSCCLPKFRILDEDKDVMFRIKGPCCTSSCCCRDVEFKILDPEGENQVGRIAKKWSGIQEFFTDADNFAIEFPSNVDIKGKATLLAACFMIDYLYFEDSGGHDRLNQ